MNLVSLLAVAGLLGAIITPVAGNQTVLLGFVSDFHLDSYYATPRAFKRHNSGCTQASAAAWGTYGCDSPARLINSSVAALLATNPAHVIVAGDWLRHDMAEEAASAGSTYAAVAAALRNVTHRVVPSPSVSTALGNNDFVPDYFFDMSAPNHPLLDNFASTLRGDGMLQPSEVASYARAGFFLRELAGTRLTVVVLNTMIWTFDLEPSTAAGDDPLGQFDFLEKALANATARGRKAIVLSHMPPTINFFDVVHAAKWTDPNASSCRYFIPRFEQRYAAVIAASRQTVVAQVFGHTHRFSFSASGDRFGNVPVIVIGAVSPVYDNNPNFFTAEWDDARGVIASMRQHTLDVAAGASPDAPWRWVAGASLPSAFGVQGPFDAPGMQAVAARMSTDDTAFLHWRQVYNGNASAGSCDAACRKLAVCYAQYVEPADVFSCLDSPIPTTTTPPATTQPPAPAHPGPPGDSSLGLWLALAALVVAGAVGAIVAVVVVRRRRRAAAGGGYLATGDVEEHRPVQFA